MGHTDDSIAAIREISGRLNVCLVILLIVVGVFVVLNYFKQGFYAPDSLLILIIGAIGGFVGLQRRLKQLPKEDLILIKSSWSYTILAPFVGGILALLLYVLFLSELLSGHLFPKFQLDEGTTKTGTLLVILRTHGANYTDYAKLIFWSFLAGYSERFVIDIIGKFEKKAIDTQGRLHDDLTNKDRS